MKANDTPTTPGPPASGFRLDWLFTLLVLGGLGWVVHSQTLDHPALQYTFLGRFPLIAAALLLVIPILFGFIAPRMLGNLLVVTVPGQFFLAALATFLAHVVASTAQALLYYGPARFKLKPAADWLVMTWQETDARWGEFSPLAALVLAAPLVLTVGWFTLKEGLAEGRNGATLLLGLCLATGLGVLAAVATTWLAIPFERVLTAYFGEDLGRIADRLGDGYGSPDGRTMGAGHVHATAFLIVAILIYAVAWPLLRPDNRGSVCRWFRAHVPPLAYVLQILIVACWLSSGMSFYLDLFRVPPVLVIAGLSICFHAISRADHYWDLLAMRPRVADAEGERAAGIPAAPSAVEPSPLPLPPDAGLDAWLHRQEAGGVTRPTLVVLAVSGGGILSAAWSTLMLARLAERYPRLASSIRLVSAVSGGSVGMSYWLERWRRAAANDVDRLPNIDLDESLAVHERASASSLEATAWGLAFPDLWRVVLPQFTRYDRGWAIEQAWMEALGHGPATIGDWVHEMEHGHLPAFSFGSTVVETGERFLFSPIATTDRDPRAGRRLSRSFLRQFPGGDVSLLTAARLSAAFPYVGPNARARYTGPSDRPELRDPPQYHFADGGFFDNFGTTTALEWIDAILERRARLVEARGVQIGSEIARRNERWENLGRVLLIQMRPFPVAEKNPPPYRSAGISGWVNGTFGPLRTLVNIWSSTQTARGDAEFDMLRKHWISRGLDVETAIFEYRGPGRLSWSLTAGDRRSLAAESDRYMDLRGEDAERTLGIMDAMVSG